MKERWEKLLRARLDAIVAAGDAPIEPNRRDAATVGVADEDEQALSEMMQTLASARNRDSARELEAINRALAKLQNAPDDFGVCEDCGDDIPEKRLTLMPWARFCLECQGKLDPLRNQKRTKITDYR